MLDPQVTLSITLFSIFVDPTTRSAALEAAGRSVDLSPTFSNSSH
jgi:hypothetical protein